MTFARFNPERAGDFGVVMRPTPVGDWVPYADAARESARQDAAINALEAQLTAVERELTKVKAEAADLRQQLWPRER